MSKRVTIAKAAAAALAGVIALGAARPGAGPARPAYTGQSSNSYNYDPCRRDANQRGTAGALIGGGMGAVIGSNAAARNARTEGALLGGLLGAIAGGVVGNKTAACTSRATAQPPPPPPPPAPPRAERPTTSATPMPTRRRRGARGRLGRRQPRRALPRSTERPPRAGRLHPGREPDLHARRPHPDPLRARLPRRERQVRRRRLTTLQVERGRLFPGERARIAERQTGEDGLEVRVGPPDGRRPDRAHQPGADPGQRQRGAARVVRHLSRQPSHPRCRGWSVPPWPRPAAGPDSRAAPEGARRAQASADRVPVRSPASGPGEGSPPRPTPARAGPPGPAPWPGGCRPPGPAGLQRRCGRARRGRGAGPPPGHRR